MDDGFPLPGRGGPCIAALGGEIEPGAARTAPGAAIGLALLARQRQLEILQPDERRPGDAVIVVGRRGVPVRKALQALHEVRGRAPAWAIARSGEVRSPRLVLAPRLRSLALLSVVPEPGGVPELGGVPEPWVVLEPWHRAISRSVGNSPMVVAMRGIGAGPARLPPARLLAGRL